MKIILPIIIVAAVLVVVAVILWTRPTSPKTTGGMPTEHANKLSPTLPQITSKSEEGFRDVVLTITDIQHTDDGGLSVVGCGLHEQEQVGIRVDVRPNMKPGIAGTDIDPSAFYKGGLRFGSIGGPSDAFVRVLSALYGVKRGNPRMKNEIILTSFALGGNPGNIEREHVDFKVFYDDEDLHGQYWELYVNIDMITRQIEIREKDSEYRGNIIKSLQVTETKGAE